MDELLADCMNTMVNAIKLTQGTATPSFPSNLII